MRVHLRRFGLLALLAAAAGGSGCSTMNNTERGAVGGGVVGTALGTAVGAATGRPLAGAALGAAGGTAIGALAGNSVDKQEQRDREVAQAVALADAQAAQQRMGLTDVIQLAKAGHNDQVIVNQIRSTRSTFQLSAADLTMLRDNGVSDRVIAEMQVARPSVNPGRVVVRETAPVVYESPPAVVVRPAPVYLYGPPPPRPVYVGGFYYHGHRHCR
jgi:hypothetical protein